MRGYGGWGCPEITGREVRLLNVNKRSSSETFEYDIALSFAAAEPWTTHERQSIQAVHLVS